MARIRTIKPSFWKHEQLGKSSMMARLTFAGLISFADDEGRGRANSDALFAELHPFCGSAVKARWKRVLSELAALRDDDGPLVIFYEVAGASFYWLTGFCRQQYIERPSKSTLPPPPNSGNDPRAIPLPSAPEGKGREGKGREGKAPPRIGGEEATPEGPPEVTEAPARTGSDQAPGGVLEGAWTAQDAAHEVREVDRDVSAFGFTSTPGIDAKRRAVEDLRRQGFTHHQIRAAAAAGNPSAAFWSMIRGLEKNGPMNGAGNGKHQRENATAYIKAGPTREERDADRKGRDEAIAAAEKALAGMDPDELDGWKADAEAEAERVKIPKGPAREIFVKNQLRLRAAKEFEIKGV